MPYIHHQPKYSQKYIRNTLGLQNYPMITEPNPELGLRSRRLEKTSTKGLKIREMRSGEAVEVVTGVVELVVLKVVQIGSTVVVVVLAVVETMRTVKYTFIGF